MDDFPAMVELSLQSADAVLLGELLESLREYPNNIQTS